MRKEFFAQFLMLINVSLIHLYQIFVCAVYFYSRVIICENCKMRYTFCEQFLKALVQTGKIRKKTSFHVKCESKMQLKKSTYVSEIARNLIKYELCKGKKKKEL